MAVGIIVYGLLYLLDRLCIGVCPCKIVGYQFMVPVVSVFKTSDFLAVCIVCDRTDDLPVFVVFIFPPGFQCAVGTIFLLFDFQPYIRLTGSGPDQKGPEGRTHLPVPPAPCDQE